MRAEVAARRPPGGGGGSRRPARRRPPPRPRRRRQTPPPSTHPPPPPPTDVAAFEQTLYPLLRSTANFCVGCHGATQIPTFAVGDVMTAYNVITTQQKVNLTNPELSRVYLRPLSTATTAAATRPAIASPRLPGRDRGGRIAPGAAAADAMSIRSAKTSFAAAGRATARRWQRGRAVPVRRRRGHDHRRLERRRARSRCRSPAWNGCKAACATCRAKRKRTPPTAASCSTP